MDPLVYANFLHEVAGKAPMFSPGKRLAIGLLLVGVGAGLLFDVRGRILPALPWVVMLGGLAVLAFAARALRERRQLERGLGPWHRPLPAPAGHPALRGPSLPPAAPRR